MVGFTSGLGQSLHLYFMSSSPPLWIIAGPTASGKTALGVEVALAANGEIVSVDSQQVYRHFDIGTAKPSAQQRAQVKHHVIDCADPSQQFSAAQFLSAADAAIADIVQRGKQPILVGGSGLYLRVLLHGVVTAPPKNADLRAALEAFAQTHGNEALHQRLTQVDAVSAAKLSVGDRLRVIRALEIFELTGQPASVHRAEHGFESNRYPFRLLVLDLNRPELYARIDARTEAMFQSGLLEEVQSLVASGYAQAAAMRSVGYAEALQVLRGELSLGDAKRLVAQRTRNYAKRQLTWFRKENNADFVKAPCPLLSALAFFTDE
jgi:tRNA dimethylallyltransferase